ncbi:interleukin-6 receptor subunit beta [Misgurnus anguillicaudatus]|uniref:interleukin-6 receptor subunit beta n=1 Tax=Misgurnus anguillicaudatus TaxID=75329 RepID=UPI003CCF3807
MDASLRIHVLLIYLFCAVGFSTSCVKIFPDTTSRIFVEVGTNFTATCYLQEGSPYTADDIKWDLDNISLPALKINTTAVSVTFTVRRNINMLICSASKQSESYLPPCRYGTFFKGGYPPLKPTNLTCIAIQEQNNISPDLQCFWDPGMRDPILETHYTLYAEVIDTYQSVCKEHLARSCTVNLSTFPYHMELKVGLIVSNALGSVRSDEIQNDASYFAKPSPPLDIQVLADNFSSSMLVVWKEPIDTKAMHLHYVIRYSQADSNVWNEVPEDFTRPSTSSFRLQGLKPYTKYVVQMRCKLREKTYQNYWSDWSTNVTNRTAESKPGGTPDLWRIIQPSAHSRNITLIWKAPAEANGKILQYDLNISRDGMKFKEVVIKLDDLDRMRPFLMYSFELFPKKAAFIQMTATNSAGVSLAANLSIPPSNTEPVKGVKHVNCSQRNGQLWVEWMPSKNPQQPFEYLLEWQKIPPDVNQTGRHWQRVYANVSNTILNGYFEQFKRYNISVYPIYNQNYSYAGRPVTIAAYTEQGPPEKGPSAKVDKSKKTSAEVTWNEIPLDERRGFITNYTIYYKTGNIEQSVTVNSDVRSHVLTDLISEREYVVHVMASTIAGSKNGTGCYFRTMKYADGQVEVIVVLVCLGFLFLSIFIIMFCLRKRETIKQLFWPQVPDPSVSSIAHWSPDFPKKANMPREDVSVVEVDVFDGKSLCEEDKTVLPLKKDKYLSEEHSSGIGGSSCMSSPRHSVSDSDEGDSGQTTASTVQYSSVVASEYKGQTPNHQPHVFARSESTQPLLDCEEHPEHLNDSRNSYFKRSKGVELGGLVQEGEEPNDSSLTFCPMEGMSPVVEDTPTSTSCYMPQQSGYRPQ